MSSLDPRQALLAWYDRHHRDLPWRAAAGNKPDPYHVLVSEVMLQQTTVATVTPRYRAFLARFPTLADLAAADLDQVLHAWQGLGYYRRARLLHQCAIATVERHGGALPGHEAELLKLPGIGAYTANAIAAIAFGRPVIPIDGNVERVLARLVALSVPPKTRPQALQEAAQVFVGPERASDLAQALMELGALVCRPQGPLCMMCPLLAHCAARQAGLVEAIPVKPAKRARRELFAVAYIVEHPDRGLLFRQRPEQGLLAGMIEVPSTSWEPARPTGAIRRAAAPLPAVDWEIVDTNLRHIFTHLTLNLELARASIDSALPLAEVEGFWCRPADFGRLALPTLTRKVLQAAGFAVPR